MKKIDARKLSADAQQQLRYQVIRLKNKIEPVKKLVRSQVFIVQLVPSGGVCTRAVVKNR